MDWLSLVALVLFLASIAVFPDQTERVLNALGPPVVRVLAVVAILAFLGFWIGMAFDLIQGLSGVLEAVFGWLDL